MGKEGRGEDEKRSLEEEKRGLEEEKERWRGRKTEERIGRRKGRKDWD